MYRTDVLAAGDAVEGIDIPADENVIATYPIAALTEAATRRLLTPSSPSSCPRRGNRYSRTSVSPCRDRAAVGSPAGTSRPAPLAHRRRWRRSRLAFVALPFVALLQRAPWSALGDLLGRSVVTDALRLSITTALAATGISLVLASRWPGCSPARGFPDARRLRALVLLPMVLPPVVGGAALLFAFGRRGLFGGAVYDSAGFLLPFSIWGVIVANTFVAMPFLVITVEAGLRSADLRYEDAAATLGAESLDDLPADHGAPARPSIVAGAVLCWARALGEFGATVTFAGNLQGRTQTMPLAVFLALESDRRPRSRSRSC